MYNIAMKKALFLDRDGVINEDFGYVFKRENFIFKSGIFEVTKAFMRQNFLIIIITNQSGIAKGYYTQEQFKKLNEFMVNEFEKNGVKIDKIYFCPHDETQNCVCRKPKPGMILRAINEFDIDTKKSFLIGDKLSDIEAGFSANVAKLFFLGEKKPQSAINFTQIHKINELLKEIQ